jgi:hypothetical protein
MGERLLGRVNGLDDHGAGYVGPIRHLDGGIRDSEYVPNVIGVARLPSPALETEVVKDEVAHLALTTLAPVYGGFTGHPRHPALD